MISFPRDGDANYGGDWGHPNLHYMNGWTSGSSDKTTIRAMGSYTGIACYCIEPGVTQNTGDVLTKWDENFWDNYPSNLNSTISPDEIRPLLAEIFQYGYTGNHLHELAAARMKGADNLSHLIATQLLVWETVVGRTATRSSISVGPTGSCDAMLDQISTAHPLYSKIMSYYNSMASQRDRITPHSPSFMSRASGSAQTFEFEWDGEPI
ncbi:MAG: thioester domain-containing protein [Dysosmobacter sp.]